MLSGLGAHPLVSLPEGGASLSTCQALQHVKSLCGGSDHSSSVATAQVMAHPERESLLSDKHVQYIVAISKV